MGLREYNEEQIRLFREYVTDCLSVDFKYFNFMGFDHELYEWTDYELDYTEDGDESAELDSGSFSAFNINP